MAISYPEAGLLVNNLFKSQRHLNETKNYNLIECLTAERELAMIFMEWLLADLGESKAEYWRKRLVDRVKENESNALENLDQAS